VAINRDYFTRSLCDVVTMKLPHPAQQSPQVCIKDFGELTSAVMRRQPWCEQGASPSSSMADELILSEIEGKLRRCPVKNLSSAALAALLVLVMASFGCGNGSHLVSIAVSPNPADLNAPQTLQLQAIGRYSDGTTKVLPSATWTFSSPSPAVTVDSKGLANCQVSGGPASTGGKVTASFAGVSGSAVISCSGPGV